MKHFRVEVETEGREVYDVIAPDEQTARRRVSDGEAGRPSVSEVTGGSIEKVELVEGITIESWASEPDDELVWLSDGRYEPACNLCEWTGRPRDTHAEGVAAIRRHRESRRHELNVKEARS